MAQAESTRMVTPEAVALEFRTANLGSRVLAFFLDGLILGAGVLLLLVALVLVGNGTGSDLPGWVAVTLVSLLLPSWLLGYFIAFETLWRGRTPGKAALGLRGVTREGAPVRFRHAAVRALLGLVDYYLGFGFFAVVFILFSRRNQRLGDLVAGTLVLRERSGLAAPAPVSFAPPPGYEAYAGTLDVTRLTTQEYQALRGFLLRAPSLLPVPRVALAQQLADPLVAHVRPAPPPGVSAEAFLRCVAAAYQHRQRAGRALPGPGWAAPSDPGSTVPLDPARTAPPDPARTAPPDRGGSGRPGPDEPPGPSADQPDEEAGPAAGGFVPPG